MGFFDFLFQAFASAQQPTTKQVKNTSKLPKNKPSAVPVESAGNAFFQAAKELVQCLYGIPYMAPAEVTFSVRSDNELMAIIADSYQTTRAPDGSTQQTTIDAAERIRLQAVFKERIYPLLEQCLAADPEHGPAFLLYPRVAEYNTRAKDRPALIAIFERFLPNVERSVKGSRAYELIKKDIDGMGGNCFDKAERHLADYHYDLAGLYLKEDQEESAKVQYQKACTLCPKIYGRGNNKIKLM
jgi:hypothetical protein